MHAPRSSIGGASANSGELRVVFVRRVHRLVQLGYERLDPSAYAQTQEPAITGDLHVAIEAVLDHPTEEWMRLYSAKDDPPENDGRRKGKQRKRIDLRIDSSFSSPRTRFRFEAKRLGKKHPVSVYLGTEGLGCFLRGDYARNEDHAGMLGYVQSGELTEWENKIAAELLRDPAAYNCGNAAALVQQPNGAAVGSLCFQSNHIRPSVGRVILIDHILLHFH